jgi:hypothetical protein
MPAFLAAMNTTGKNYEWYKDGVKIAVTTTFSYNAVAAGSYTVRYEDANGCWSMLSVAIQVMQSASLSLNWQTEPTTPVTIGDQQTYTVLAAPAADSYLWTSSNGSVATATPIGNTVSVDYIGLGTTDIRVEATNACGTASLQKTITVDPGCSPVPSVNITPNGTITKYFNSDGTPKIPGDQHITFTATGATNADNYEWFENNVTQQSGTSNQFSYTAIATAGSYAIKVVATNGCSTKDATATVKVVKDNPPDLSGNYRLNGKTCYDVWVTDWAAGNECLPKLARVDDFAGGYSFVYNFVASASFSDLYYEFYDLNNLVASHSMSGTGNSTLTVNFASDVKSKATGTNRTTALKFTIIAKYKDSGNLDKQITLEVSVQDCSCGCSVKKAGGGWITFLCYNLDASENVKTISPAQQAALNVPNDNYGG